MATLTPRHVFLKTTFIMVFGDFLFGYVIFEIFQQYIALFGTGGINNMIVRNMGKVKFYNEFEITEKKAFEANYG